MVPRRHSGRSRKTNAARIFHAFGAVLFALEILILAASRGQAASGARANYGQRSDETGPAGRPNPYEFFISLHFGSSRNPMQVASI